MSKMYDNITGRSPIATDDLGYIGTGNKASDILNNDTTDYNDLNNKPTINSVELKGNKTSSDLGLQPELTEAQTNAVNSGITAALTEQITTNQTNISNIQTTVASYHKASGTDIYFSETEPMGNIAVGSYWLSTTATKIYERSNNIINPDLTFNSSMANTPNIAFPLSSGGNRKTAFIYVEPNTTYTFGGTSCDRLIIGGWDSVKTKAELETYTVESPLTADSNIAVYTSNVPANYTFTTSSTTHMIGIFYALNNDVTDAHLNVGNELLPYDVYVSPGWY